MNGAEPKRTVTRLFEEVFNSGRLEMIDALLAPNYVEHSPAPGCTPDREGAKQWVSMLRRAFPDLDVRLDDVIAENDRVAVRGAAVGTHSDDFMGIASTGKQVRFAGMDVFALSEGQITEHWGLIDQGALIAQLGSMPEDSIT